MITSDFRPKNWAMLKGQETVKQLLFSILRNPSLSPHSLIFQGELGTGKTSAARLFAQSLQCENRKTDYLCGHCLACRSGLSAMWYAEYDSSDIGTLDQVRSLRDYWSASQESIYRVYVFDEAHVLSSPVQNSLLKTVEDAPNNTFFIFCTTDVKELLPTLHSRSIDLRFHPLSNEDIINSIDAILTVKNMSIMPETYKILLARANGHMRDAHNLVNHLLLTDEETFCKTYSLSDNLWIALFYSIAKKDRKLFEKILDALSKYPLEYLRIDYGRTIQDLIKSYVHQDSKDKIKIVLDLLKSNAMPFFKICLSPFILDSFSDDYRLLSSWYIIFDQFGRNVT